MQSEGVGYAKVECSFPISLSPSSQKDSSKLTITYLPHAILRSCLITPRTRKLQILARVQLFSIHLSNLIHSSTRIA